MTLTVILACSKCRRLFVSSWYDLREMFGQPAVCDECSEATR